MSGSEHGKASAGGKPPISTQAPRRPPLPEVDDRDEEVDSHRSERGELRAPSIIIRPEKQQRLHRQESVGSSWSSQAGEGKRGKKPSLEDNLLIEGLNLGRKWFRASKNWTKRIERLEMVREEPDWGVAGRSGFASLRSTKDAPFKRCSKKLNFIKIRDRLEEAMEEEAAEMSEEWNDGFSMLRRGEEEPHDPRSYDDDISFSDTEVVNVRRTQINSTLARDLGPLLV